MGYRSQVTIIIQAKEDRTFTLLRNGVVDESLREVHKLDKPTQEEEKWAMFLTEVAVKPETELAWREIISSGSDDSYGNTLELDKEARRITMHFSDVKWYEGYEDVDSYMALFHSIKPYEDYIDAIFLRIGEDREDLEEHIYGSGYSLASIERSIVIN